MNHSVTIPTRWHPVADEQALQRQALTVIVESARRAIQARGQFHLVLAGGTTPRAIYALLTNIPAKWSAWHIYFGDERCLPATDSARNSVMASLAWLDHVPIPRSQILPIAGESGPEQAAMAYAASLSAVADFDLVLLGVGEDGHTASLFPGHEWGVTADSPDALAVWDAPKPPPERVSMSASRLSRAREVLFLVSGASKQAAVSAWLAGADIPARAIAPAAGVDVLVESALLGLRPEQ